LQPKRSLAIEPVELVSVLHTAPANGAPSSVDYYDGELEKLTDLTTLALFINGTLLPMLNALPSQASDGIIGTSIFTDTSSQDALVYDAATSESLTITQSLRLLYGMWQTLNTGLTNLAQQVAALQARLSALYGMWQTLNTGLTNLAQQVAALQARLSASTP
jgi:hypothetical protein